MESLKYLRIEIYVLSPKSMGKPYRELINHTKAVTRNVHNFINKWYATKLFDNKK